MLYENVSNEYIFFLKNALIDKLPNEFKIENSLSFSESGVTALPQKLIVGGNLYLTNCKILQIYSINKIIVCGNLYLDANIEIPDINLIYVFGAVIGTEEQKKKIRTFNELIEEINLSNDNIMASKDGYFIIYDKQITLDKGSIVFYRNIFKNKKSIIVYYYDDDSTYFYCDSLRDGYDKIYHFQIHLRAQETCTHIDDYTVNSLVSLQIARELFYICTGACKEGIDEFIENLENKKDYYTIQEVIDLTKGKFFKSYLFEEYFTNNNI